MRSSKGAICYRQILIVAFAFLFTTVDSEISKKYDNDGQLISRRLQEQQEYHPCSLCQGLTLLSDAMPYDFLNTTCAEFDTLVMDPEFKADSFRFANLAPNSTNNNMGGCRSDETFNELFSACCQSPIPVYQCETNIQNHIFSDARDYNTAVTPIVNSNEKLNVSVWFQYEALEDIDFEHGTASIYVSMELTWKDPRLSWVADANNLCANSITVFTGHDVETTSIWIPDFDLLNRIDGVQSMPERKAIVYADGTVSWYLAGGLNTFCAFKGLGTIPFDVLGCQMLFGEVIRKNDVEFIPERPNYMFYGAFDLTYSEYTPIPELAEQGLTFGGNVIYYNLYFKRATAHYVQNIVIPTVILTYLSFFTYLLDMRVGERLGFGMALALVAVAQQIVTSGMTPISDNRLWLDKFVAWSFYWVLISVVQSVIVGLLYFIREDKKEKEEARKSEVDEEEVEPLTTRSVAPNGSSATGESEDIRAVAEYLVDQVSPNKEKAVKKGCLKYAWEKFVYTYPLRRYDMIMLSISIITYSTFVGYMHWMATTENSYWLQDEPNWLEEDFNPSSNGAYINGNPNNR